MKTPFIKAEWRKLILANYIVPPEILTPYLPQGVKIDTWQGNCYVSLVGFMFKNTKVKGLSIPFHINFEEVNLRFYVKRMMNNGVRRGVVFIKEIVPKKAITFIANMVYREHYQTKKMTHLWNKTAKGEINIQYKWENTNRWNSISVISSDQPKIHDKTSEATFITEHYWGYTKLSNNKTSEYEVIHPKWKVYPVLSSFIDVDFKETYGEDFSILDHKEPHSVYLAEGSEITVEKNQVI